MPNVLPHQATQDGEPVFWLEAASEGGGVPVLYVHGVPTAADDWTDFLERTGGVAPDLPGYGRSGKRGDGDYSMDRYGPWLERFLAERGIDRFALVVHDWGALALTLAQRHPERIQRLVIINAVPLLPGFAWHRLARVWRRPGLGELVVGSVGRFTLARATRRANVTPLPGPWLERVLAHLDQGTQRALLRLHRSGDPDALAAAGRRLGTLRCPALVVWGDEDPYLAPAFADAYAAAIPGARLLHVPGAGHWPWLDQPQLVDTVATFLAGDTAA